MSKYSEREKRGHFNKLRGHASHVDADLKLLEKLSPQHELLSTTQRKDRIADQVLLVLLDLTTSCDIVDFRRKFSKSKSSLADELMIAKYIDNYNKNIVLLMGKYGVDSELDTEEKIKEVFDSLGFTPFIENVVSTDGKTIFDMIGCTLQDCHLVETIEEIDIDENISIEEQFRKDILNLIDDSILKRDFRRKVQQELADKESELDDKELVLEKKEAELEDKEQELTEKEAELEEKVKKSKKKAAPKTKNIPK